MADKDVDPVAERLAEPEPVQIVIPYFSFRVERITKKLIVNVSITSPKIRGLQYELKDNRLCFISGVHMQKICVAQILLPVKVVHPTSRMPVFIDDDYPRSFHIEFKIIPGFLLPSRRLYRCPGPHIRSLRVSEPRSVEDLDLDVITPHLSWQWRRETFREPSPRSFEDQFTDLIRDISLEPDEKSRLGRYGFACRYHAEMANDEEDGKNFLELPDPKNTDPLERRIPQWEIEKNSFDLEHYHADFFLQQNEDDDREFKISSMIHFRPYWDSLRLASDYTLKPASMTLLAGLPCKDFSLSRAEREEVLHSLFDIILAYAYEFRLHRGRSNSESSWNICKLSATLSCHQVHRHPGDAMQSFMRRSLIFPAYRHWTLSMMVYKDVLQIFNLGRRQILNCLVHIHELLENDIERKFLNVLYIEDYLIWIQQVHPDTIVEYLQFIEMCGGIKKENIFEKLPQMEQVAIEMLMKFDFDQYQEWCKASNLLNIEVEKRIINKCIAPYDYSSDSNDSDSDDSSSGSNDSSSNSDNSSSDLSDIDTASVEDSHVLPKNKCNTKGEEKSLSKVDTASMEDSHTLPKNKCDTKSKEESDDFWELMLKELAQSCFSNNLE